MVLVVRIVIYLLTIMTKADKQVMPLLDDVLEAYVVRDPDLNRDIVSLGFIKDLKVDGGRVAFTIELTTPACPVKDQMRDQARAAVMQLAGRDRGRRADERAGA